MKIRKYYVPIIITLVTITVLIAVFKTTNHRTRSNITPTSQVSKSTVQQTSGQKIAPKSNSPIVPASDLFQKGLQAFSAKDYHNAVTLENQAIQSDGAYYEAYNVKGIALCFSGDFTDGIANINQSLRIHPNYGYGLFNKALALELYAHYDDAIEVYQQAIQLHTNDWWVAWSYYGIASIYGRRGDVQNTVRYLKQAIQKSPGIKNDARTEKDFNHVRNSPIFQSVIR